MGSELALVLVIAALLAGGSGIGLQFGLKPATWVGWVGFAGVAYLLGFASFVIAAQLVVVIGLPPWPALVVPVLASLFLFRQRFPRPAAFRAARIDRLALAILCVLILLLLLVGAVIVIRNPLTAWDSWSIWARKAIMLRDSLDTLKLPYYEFTHPDYPIGIPAAQSAFFSLAGTNDTRVGDLPAWLLVPSGLAALAAFAPGRPRFYVPVIASIAVLPAVTAQTLFGYADVPLALVLSVAVLVGGRWLRSREPRHIWTFGLLIGGAICLKNEGVIVGLLVLILLTFFGRKSLRSLWPAWALALLAFLPWRLWLVGNGIEGDLPLSRAFDPVYLVDNMDRPWRALGNLLNESLFDVSLWEKVPWSIALAAALVLLLLALDRIPGRFGLLGALAALLALLFAYWVSPHDLDWHLLNSSDRVILLPVLILLAASLLVVDDGYGKDDDLKSPKAPDESS